LLRSLRVLPVEAAGEQQRAEHAVAKPDREALRVAQVPPGVRVAAVEQDDRGDRIRAALDVRFERRTGFELELGQRVVPPTHVEQQLPEDGLSLRNPYRIPRVVGLLLDVACGGDG